MAEIEKLKQQTRDLCSKVAICDVVSGQLTGGLTDKSGSIASIEKRFGLICLVSRLHEGDQKASYNVRDVCIGNKISNAGEGSFVKALVDSVLLDTTSLANDNDTSESQGNHSKSVANPLLMVAQESHLWIMLETLHWMGCSSDKAMEMSGVTF